MFKQVHSGWSIQNSVNTGPTFKATLSCNLNFRPFLLSYTSLGYPALPGMIQMIF